MDNNHEFEGRGGAGSRAQQELELILQDEESARVVSKEDERTATLLLQDGIAELEFVSATDSIAWELECDDIFGEYMLGSAKRCYADGSELSLIIKHNLSPVPEYLLPYFYDDALTVSLEALRPEDTSSAQRIYYRIPREDPRVLRLADKDYGIKQQMAELQPKPAIEENPVVGVDEILRVAALEVALILQGQNPDDNVDVAFLREFSKTYCACSDTFRQTIANQHLAEELGLGFVPIGSEEARRLMLFVHNVSL